MVNKNTCQQVINQLINIAILKSRNQLNQIS